MAEQHNKQNLDCIKQEAVYSSNSNSPIGYSPGASSIPEKTQPRTQRNTTPTFKQQPYSPYDSPNHGSPQYPPRCGPGAGPSPVSPKTPTATNVQMKQTQQVHMTQTTAQQIQVSMAQQNVPNDMNAASASMASHQGIYFVNQNTPNCNVKLEPNQNFINISQQQQQQQQQQHQQQQQNINFNQQQQQQQQQQIRHHNASTSTNNAAHHSTDGPIGDQHKLTPQQLQHQHHLMRAQQVSMAQNAPTDINPSSVSVAAQQGMYFANQANTCNVKMEPNQNFINVSQTININFNQQQSRHHVATSTAATSLHESQLSEQQHKMSQQQMMLMRQQMCKQQQQHQQQQQYQQQQQHLQQQQQAQQKSQQQSHHVVQLQQQHQQHPAQHAQQQHHQQQSHHQQQQAQQQQLRLQQMPQQKNLQNMIRPPPPEYSINGRQTSGQFQGIPCNMPQRLPQQNTFPGNVPLHNNAMNMMPGHVQQMPIRSLPNPKQQKPTMNMQHSNYPMSLNLPMSHGMNNPAANNVSALANQTYNPQAQQQQQQSRPTNANMPLANTMSHMPNTMTNLHHNPHRSQEIPSAMQNTNVNSMSSLNTNTVIEDFNLDFLEQQFGANELMNFNINGLM